MSVDYPRYAPNSYHSTYVEKPGSVTAAKVVLGLTAGFLALNLVVSLAQSASLPPLSTIIVITLTVLVGVASAKVSESRAWGLSGASIGLVLAGLMLVMTSMVNDAPVSASLKSSVNTTLMIAAAIYGVLGITVICLLNSSSAREYFDSTGSRY